MTTYIIADNYDIAADEADRLNVPIFELVPAIPARRESLRGRRWVDGDRLVIAPVRYAVAIQMLDDMAVIVGCPRSVIEQAMEETGLPVPSIPVDDEAVAKAAEAVRKIERSLR